MVPKKVRGSGGQSQIMRTNEGWLTQVTGWWQERAVTVKFINIPNGW